MMRSSLEQLARGNGDFRVGEIVVEGQAGFPRHLLHAGRGVDAFQQGGDKGAARAVGQADNTAGFLHQPGDRRHDGRVGRGGFGRGSRGQQVGL